MGDSLSVNSLAPGPNAVIRDAMRGSGNRTDKNVSYLFPLQGNPLVQYANESPSINGRAR